MKLMNGVDLIAEADSITWDDKEHGWRCGSAMYVDPGKMFTLDQHPQLSPVQFKMCFTAQERLAVKGLLATDAVLADAYSILDDPRLTTVDLSLASNQAMIDYLVTLGVLTSDRAAQVKAGVML